MSSDRIGRKISGKCSHTVKAVELMGSKLVWLDGAQLCVCFWLKDFTISLSANMSRY